MEILFGLIAGMVTGLGMGGGTILILLLTYFNGFEQHVAQATNLVFFIPTSLAAMVTNLKNKNVDMKVVKVIVAFGVLGAIIGSIISNNISSNYLKKYFAIFLLIIAIYEIYKMYKEYKIERKNA